MVGSENEYLMIFDNDVKEVEPLRNEVSFLKLNLSASLLDYLLQGTDYH